MRGGTAVTCPMIAAPFRAGDSAGLRGGGRRDDGNEFASAAKRSQKAEDNGNNSEPEEAQTAENGMKSDCATWSEKQGPRGEEGQKRCPHVGRDGGTLRHQFERLFQELQGIEK